MTQELSSRITQQEENNKLLESFLERTFFKGWKNPGLRECENFRSMEIFFNAKCNLACKYCYLNNYGDKLYPPEIQDNKQLLKNLEMILDWLIEREMAPQHLEYFSGEALVQEVGLEGLEMILDKFKDAKRKPEVIVIPTNFTFLLYDKLTERIEELLDRSRKLGIPIGLSASFDGKYCEGNRPFRNNKEVRDDTYYDKAFAFAKKWNCGFHPMIYSGFIERWKDNWLWFQENFKKHDICWYSIYLLEVRNVEWTREQMFRFGEFVEFLIDWTFHHLKENINQFIDFVFFEGFNLLKTTLTTGGRGLGCSIQSAMTVRVGDLAWVPCHRTAYPPFLLGNFRVQDNKIVGLEAYNPELMIGMYSHHLHNQPWCSSCLLQSLCTGGCLGSQFETHGDLYAPIPTVCELQHVKVASMIRAYQKLGVFDIILARVNQEKEYALRKLVEMIKEPRKN